MLGVLERAGARATFFLVGEQVRRDPALAREIVAAGHAVALHGDRHRCLLRLTPRALDDDLDARRRDGRRRHRPRAAAVPPAVRRSTAPPAWRSLRRRGWRRLLWSRWGRDWAARARPAAIAARATRDLSRGRRRAPARRRHLQRAGLVARAPRTRCRSVLEAVARAGLGLR